MNRPITVFALVLLAASLPTVAQGDPCKLLTSAEMESVLGMKVSGFTHGSAPGGTLTCNGDAGKGKSVGLMLSIQKPGDPKIADPMSWLENPKSRERQAHRRAVGDERDLDHPFFAPV